MSLLSFCRRLASLRNSRKIDVTPASSGASTSSDRRDKIGRPRYVCACMHVSVGPDYANSEGDISRDGRRPIVRDDDPRAPRISNPLSWEKKASRASLQSSFHSRFLKAFFGKFVDWIFKLPGSLFSRYSEKTFEQTE